MSSVNRKIIEDSELQQTIARALDASGDQLAKEHNKNRVKTTQTVEQLRQEIISWEAVYQQRKKDLASLKQQNADIEAKYVVEITELEMKINSYIKK